VRPRTLADVAGAVQGRILPPTAAYALVTGVAIDSRAARPGDLFVALAGTSSDGHDHVDHAVRLGAAAALVRDDRAGTLSSGPLVVVPDPARALIALASEERNTLTARVVGITGSSGKTITKDFTSAVLARRYRVVSSPASFNNEIGLPLTILGAEPGTEALVCEMGSRGPGHIRLLCGIARPEIGVVTNVGVAHMELFGSPEVLREAKAELPEALPPDGVAVLNADDAVVRTFASRTPAKPVFFGTGADLAPEAIEVSRSTGRARFVLRTPEGSAPVELPAPGEHLVSDALAAAAVGWVLGVAVEDIAAGLAGAELSRGRMEVLETHQGLRVINDAYNANPASMAAGLKAARWMAGDGRFVAVLGQMAELGPIASREHERVGELLARLGVDGLVVVGPEARLIAVGAEREGVEPERIVVAGSVDEAVTAVRSLTGPGDLVLVKGSRVAGLERVAQGLAAIGDGTAA
jgi:UDP-N-acetylmuramoyl-tripeptide--D-alanyl-D-alanine ligase